MGPALLLAAIFGAHAAKLQGTCVFLPFLIIGAHAAKLQGTLCVSTFSYYWGPCSEAAGNLCVSTFSYWGPCSEAAGNPVCFYLFLLLGVKQRSCRTLLFSYVFLLLLLLLSCHWSQWQPIEPLVQK